MGALDFSGKAEPVDGALDFSDDSLEAHNRAPSIMDVAKAALIGYVPDTAKALGWGLEKFGVEHGTAMRKAGAQTERDIVESMTPGGQRAYSAPVFEGDGLSDLHLGEHPGGALAMGAFRSAPQMAMMAPIGAPVAAGVSRVIPAAARAAPGIKGLVARNAPGALGFGGAEGVQAATQNAEQTQSEIEGMSHADLEKSPRYLELLETMGREESRKTLAAEAASDVFKRTLPWTGGVGIATGGGALGELVKPGAKSVLKGIVKGAGEEALQEAPQSAGEELIQNLAKRDYVDPTTDPWKGVAASAASGAAVGGVTGGALGGGAHAFSGRTVDGEVMGRETAVDPLAAARGAAQDTESAAAVVRRTVDSIKQRVAAMGAQPKETTSGNEPSGNAAADETGARAPAGAKAGTAPGVPGQGAEAVDVKIFGKPVEKATDQELAEAAQQHPMSGFREAAKAELARRAGVKSSDAAGTETGTSRAPVSPGIRNLADDEAALSQPAKPAVQVLRGAGNQGVRSMEGELRDVPGGRGAPAVTGVDAGPGGQQQGVRAGQRPVGAAGGAEAESAQRDALRARGENASAVGVGDGKEPAAGTLGGQGQDGRLDDRTGAHNAGGRSAEAQQDANAERQNADDRGVGAGARDQVRDAQGTNPQGRPAGQSPDSLENQKRWDAYRRASMPHARRVGIKPVAPYIVGPKGELRKAKFNEPVADGEKLVWGVDAMRNLRRARLKEIRRPNPSKDSLNDWIAKRGGLDITERLDVSGDDKNHAINASQWLFTKKGAKVDDLARAAWEDGFLSHDEYGDVDGGVQALKDKIRAELGGTKQYSQNSDTPGDAEQQRASDDEGYEQYKAQALALADEVEGRRPDDWGMMTEDEKGASLDHFFGDDSREGAAPSGAQTGARTGQEALGQREPGQDDEEVDGERPKASRRADAKEVAARTDSLFDAAAAKQEEKPAVEAEAPGDDAKPLFIPLNTEYYDAFADGSKGTEYRKYGPQWNEKTAKVGRRVVLSKGYGKQARLEGTVVAFKRGAPPDDPAWKKIYGDAQDAAHITIKVDAKPALELKGQTEAEIKADADAKRRADEEKKKKEAAPAPEEFNLSGSDRKADVAAAHGQKDLLAAPANAEPKRLLPADRRAAAAAEQEASAPVTLADHDAFRKRLYDGEVSIEEYRAQFERVIAQKDRLIEQLEGMKKDDLLKELGGFSASRYRGEKKERIVQAAYDDMQMGFTLSRGLSFSMGKGAQEAALRKMIDGTTAADLKEFADRVAAQRKERKDRIDGIKKALNNPETLAEFEDFIKYHKAGEPGLTPEQRAKYDELVAEKTKGKRVEDQEKKATVQAAGELVGATITETKHTQKGHDLFVVKLERRVERDVYDQLSTAAKKLGGYYSSYTKGGAVAGFQFKAKADAEAFQKLAVEGDAAAATEAAIERKGDRREEKKNAAAERLAEMADKLEASANESLNRDRLSNTNKRARQASSAEAGARSDIAFAKTLRNLSEAIESGEAKHLDGIRTKAQVATLTKLAESARYETVRKQYPSYVDFEKHGDRPLEVGDIDAAEYPALTGRKEDFQAAANRFDGKPGSKRLADRFRNMARAIHDDEWHAMGRQIVEEAVEKAGTDTYAVPWHWAENLAKIKRLEAAGIPNVNVLRAALREFIQFKGEQPKADKVKELERALVGKDVGFDFFPTPAPLAARMAEMLDVKPGMRVLEPSAGKGNLADAVREEYPGAEVDVVEQSNTLREILKEKGYSILGHDFNDFEKSIKYDRIIMNPPFSDGIDADHVRKAYAHLAPGGRLVAIAGEGIFFRKDKKSQEFREWFDSVNGTSEQMEGAFLDRHEVATTGVNSRLLVIDKSAEQAPMASRQSENIEEYKPQTKTGKSGQPLFWNDHIALAKPDFQYSLADGERTVGYGIYDVKNLDAEGKPTKVGSLLMDLGEDDKVVGLQNIEIRQPLRQSGKGLGETVIATLLAHNGALPIRIHNIQHHRDDGWDALPFWKKMGTQLDNFSTDPEVEINGWLSRTDYLKARGVGGKLSRGLNRATDLPAESGTADDGRGRRGEGDRGRARAGGVVQSAAVGAGAAQDRLRADAGGEGAGERGRAGTSSGNGQGLTPEQVRARLIEAFGPKIDTLLQDKVLNIVETPADLPPKLAAVSQSLDEAWYDPKANDGEGAIYFIASGLRPERVVPVLLHELGEHYNLPKMLGADGYAALHREVRALHARGTSSAVEDAWRHVRENYPSLKEAGVDFASEVIAKVGESAAGRNLPFFKRLLAAVRTWLLKLGLKANLVRNLTDEDLRTLVEASARQAIRKAGSAMAFGRDGLRSAKPGVFYSELARKIGDLKLEAAPAAQWKGTIKGLKGVKAEEIEWSGINDWLDMQAGKVTKDQVVDYLRENGVRVEETVLGETGSYTTHIDQLVVDLDAKGYDIINEPNLETGDPEPVGLTRRSDKRTFDLFTEADRREDFDASIDDLPEDVAALAEDLRVVTAEPDVGSDAKFEKYTLPGGENYRELLLTLPASENEGSSMSKEIRALGITKPLKEVSVADIDRARGSENLQERWDKAIVKDTFRSGHFDQPNILAHVRFNERTDAEGKKVLFLEEIQSDWAQKGKRSGFMGTTEEHAKAFFGISDASWAKASAEDRAAYRQEMLDATKDGRIRKNGLVPMAPFVGKTEAWVSLALKRMIRYGAENGFDKISWTSGEQQTDRYDLSHHVDQVKAFRRDDGTYDFMVRPKGERIHKDINAVEEQKLAETVGKDLAEKISKQPPGWNTYNGVDLKVGGAGMRAFYDDVLPKIANRLLEKVGGERVGDVTVRSDTSPVDTGDDSLAFRMAAKVEDKLFGKKNNFLKQPGFDITPAMREQALKGMPMFSRGGEPKASRAASPQTDLFGSPEENKRKVDLFTPRGQDNLADRAKSYLASFLDSDRTFNWWHRSVGTQYHKATVSAPFRRVFNEGQAFLTDTNRFSMQAEEKAPQVLLRVEGIKDLAKRPPSPAEIETLGRTLFEGTLFGGADPTKGKVFTDEELKAKGLNEKQVGLYRQVRASIDDSIDTVAKSTIARLLRTYEMKIDRDMSLADVTTDALEQLEAHRAEMNLAIEAQTEDPAERHRVSQQIDAVQTAIGQVDAIRKRAVALQQGGYMPLMRFGRHSVNVFEIDDAGKPKEQFFGLYESQGEANRAAAALKQEFPDATIEKGMMSKEAYRIFQGISPDTIELFSEIAGLDEHPLMQQYIQMAVSERSAMKRMLKRKGVPGFDWDVPKVLANFITSNARAASGNYHHAEMLKSIEEIPKGQGDVKDEAVRLYEYLTKPQEEAAALRGYMFFHFMGGSIATAMVNMTQPVMMTAPRLAVDHNIAKVSKELGRAMLEAARQNAPTDAAGKAMKKAEEEGIVAPHEIYQLMAEAKGGIGRNIALRQFTRVWGGLFSLAEAWNRKATFLAAYRLAESTKGMDPYDYAVRVVNETQGLYNRGNRPNWARGTIGATVMTFRQYGIAYLELLKRLPAPQRALALGILVLVAGLQGLPGADDLDDILDTLGQWMGYATNSKQWKRKAIEAMFGKDIGQFVLNGASAIPAMPLDVQMRLGLGNLIPGTSMFKPSDGSDKGQEIAEAFGPAGGLAKSGFDVAREAFQGDIAGMAKAGLPASLRNAYQALEMFQTGEYRDSKNRRVVDASAQDAFVKAIGFNPTVVARESRKVNETLTNINLQKETETSIVEQWVRGIIDHKDNEVDAAQERLASWNEKNPDLVVAINKQQIARRVREARRSREERFIRSAPKEIRGSVTQELRD